jgi:hypothetical protein
MATTVRRQIGWLYTFEVSRRVASHKGQGIRGCPLWYHNDTDADLVWEWPVSYSVTADCWLCGPLCYV